MSSKTKRNVWIGVGAAAAFVVIVLMVFLLPMKGKKTTLNWNQDAEYKAAAKLVKQDGKEYRILQLTDVQLWTLAAENTRGLKMVDEMIEQTKPDLIVLTGDQVSGIPTDLLTYMLVNHLDSHKIPWAATFGNHDNQGRADTVWQGEQYAKSEYGIFDQGFANVQGVGNYTVDLTDTDGKTLWSLIMMDSHDKRRYEKEDGTTYEDYDYIYQNQIDWYQWVIESLKKQNGGAIVPSMAFFHIPLPEFEYAITEYGLWENPKEKKYSKPIPQEYGFGQIRERICCPPENTGFFAKVKELGSTKDIFVGHDHSNDASVLYQGIRMTYGVKVGPSPKPWNDAVHYGATMITISADNQKVKTEQMKFDEADRTLSVYASVETAY